LAFRLVFFFFQAEDGIRDYKVTGVQTCALPISVALPREPPLLLAVGLEVPPAGSCPGDELRLDVRIAREKAGTAFDDLVDQDDRREVEGDQLYGRPRGLPQIGLPSRQLVEGQGRIGEDPEIHVANPGTARVQRRAEDVYEQDPSVPREQLGSVPGSPARLGGSERRLALHRPRIAHGAVNPRSRRGRSRARRASCEACSG